MTNRLHAGAIVLQDLRGDRPAIQLTRQWITDTFQLLDGSASPLPPLRIPYTQVQIPVSQAVLEMTGVECGQVRGMTSTPSYEAAFLRNKNWDAQFPGVVTVAVNPRVTAIHQKHFVKGKRLDDEDASKAFRMDLGAALVKTPEDFMFDVTDGAHRTKLGKENFGATVTFFSASPHLSGTYQMMDRPVVFTTFSPPRSLWSYAVLSPWAPTNSPRNTICIVCSQVM